MRYVLLSSALVMFFAVEAMADNGNVATNVLEKAGLSSMKVMTDTEGLSVRGAGFANAWSFSYAFGGLPNYQSQTSPPNYVSVHTSSFGWGSFAGGSAFVYAK